MRMPRMQVYLPEELYREVKERGLPASELLQAAVAAEVRRQKLEAEAAAYIAELIAEFGEPTEEEMAEAEAVVDRIVRTARRNANDAVS